MLPKLCFIAIKVDYIVFDVDALSTETKRRWARQLISNFIGPNLYIINTANFREKIGK